MKEAEEVASGRDINEKYDEEAKKGWFQDEICVHFWLLGALNLVSRGIDF